jgi:hypothetical protein
MTAPICEKCKKPINPANAYEDIRASMHVSGGEIVVFLHEGDFLCADCVDKSGQEWFEIVARH